MNTRYRFMLLSLVFTAVTVAQEEDVSTEPESVVNEELVTVPEVETSPAENPEPGTNEVVETETEIDVEDPEPEIVKPKQPRVDPDLRNYYLRDNKLGGVSGPSALKKPKLEKPEGSWVTDLELGLTGYRGNNDSEFMILKLKTEKKVDNNSTRFSARGTIGNKEGERDRENGELEAAMRRVIEDRWYYTAEIRYFTDKIADVDYQVVSVLSPGYQFIRTESAHLSIELGPAYIAEKKGGVQKDFAAVRVALMMDKLIDQRILLWERFEYLPAIDDTSVYLLVGEVGVESILTEHFRLRTVIQTRYDSDPAEGKENQDVFLAVSFVTVF